MKAQFIYEKFREDSDPIKDLGIGTIDLYEMYLKLVPKKDRNKGYDKVHHPHEKWLNFLRETVNGRTIKFKRGMYPGNIVIKKIEKVSVLQPDQVFFYFNSEIGHIHYNFKVDLKYPITFVS